MSAHECALEKKKKWFPLWLNGKCRTCSCSRVGILLGKLQLGKLRGRGISTFIDYILRLFFISTKKILRLFFQLLTIEYYWVYIWSYYSHQFFFQISSLISSLRYSILAHLWKSSFFHQFSNQTHILETFQI